MGSLMARIISVGTALPENVRDNFYYENYLDTSDEWITQRTGIKTRRIWENPPADATAQLGAEAAERALKKAGLTGQDIDTVICATFTPDSLMPSTAVDIAHKIGAKGTFAFDMAAACSGFVFGLTMADSLIKSGQSKRVLLVGSEVISRTLDWNDRGTCLLFGDGAGAVILEASEGDAGVIAAVNYTDGTAGEALKLSLWEDENFLTMSGRTVYRHAVNLMPEQVEKALEKAGMTIDDVDLLVPHQANIRIIEKVGERLGIDPAKVVINVEKYGNTSSATIPIAIEEAMEDGRIKENSVVAITALGGGITAGAAIIRF